MPSIADLFVYPIKGLSAQRLGAAAIRAGAPFPGDREFALLRPGAPIDPAAPHWAKKGNFAMLMLDEALARATTRCEDGRVRAEAPGRPPFAGGFAQEDERRAFGEWLHALTPQFSAPPTWVRAPGGHFMDKPDNVISLINLETVRALAALWGRPVDPMRFRANIYIEGAPAWSEFGWIGQDIALGGLAFRVDRRNGRCAAVNVDPATGVRDLDIPRWLRDAFGHKDLGVYLFAREDGRIAPGDAVVAPAGEAAPSGADAEGVAPATERFVCAGC